LFAVINKGFACSKLPVSELLFETTWRGKTNPRITVLTAINRIAATYF